MNPSIGPEKVSSSKLTAHVSALILLAAIDISRPRPDRNG
jgi:hypothetical protein